MNRKSISIRSEIKAIFDLIKEFPQQNLNVEQGVRILLNLAPVGGAIEKLIFGNKDKKELEQIKVMLCLIGASYNEINQDKLDKDYLNSDDFYVLFKKTFERMRFEFREEKLILYRNFLINCSVKDSDLKIDKNYLLNKLDAIELEHFKIMEYYLKKGYTRSSAVGSAADARGRDLEEISPHYETYETDLVNFGFFKLIQVNSGENRYILQPLGIEFIKFVSYGDIN